jgi:hypothetical protein
MHMHSLRAAVYQFSAYDICCMLVVIDPALAVQSVHVRWMWMCHADACVHAHVHHVDRLHWYRRYASLVQVGMEV